MDVQTNFGRRIKACQIFSTTSVTVLIKVGIVGIDTNIPPESRGAEGVTIKAEHTKWNAQKLVALRSHSGAEGSLCWMIPRELVQTMRRQQHPLSQHVKPDTWRAGFGFVVFCTRKSNQLTKKRDTPTTPLCLCSCQTNFSSNICVKQYH